jgi:hypothetical protein
MQVIRTYGLANASDLTTPTSTQSSIYRLGDVVEVYDDTVKDIRQYMYVKAHTAGLTAYQPYVVTHTGTSGAEWMTGAVVSTLFPVNLVCVPQVAFTASYFGWVAIKGRVTALGDAQVLDGTYISLVASGTGFVADTTDILAPSYGACGNAITGSTGAAATGTYSLSGFRVATT